MAKLIAAILARVSRPTQNMESQVSDLIAKAEGMGYTVPDRLIFKEQISGVHRGRKESLERILAAIDDTKNKIDAVFIWEITRLNRDSMDFATELNEFIIRKAPVYFLDVEMWSLDPTTKDRLDANINKLIGASAYGLQEWDKIAKRTKRGRDELAKKGLYVGHLADGYMAIKEGEHKRIVPDDDRKQVIIDIFDYFIGGKSTDEIAKILNAGNVPTTAHYRFISNKFNYKQYYHKRKNDIEYDRTLTKWSGTSVSSILSNKWYIGSRYYHIKEQIKLKEEDWEVYHIDPIIEIEKWEKAQELKKERAISFRSDKKSKKHNYILSNLVYCGSCGSKLYGHYTGKNNHYYCSSVENGVKCGTQGLNKENFEAIICQIVKSRALNTLVNDTPDVTTDFFRLSEDEKRRIKREIKTIELLVGDIDKQLAEIEKGLYSLYDELDKNDASHKKYIYAAIDKRERKKSELQREREEQVADIMLFNKKLNSSENIDSLIKLIMQTNDIKELQKLVEATVSRITVHTIDRSISYVIITYLNGKTDSFIYSYRLLKHNFINFSRLGWKEGEKPVFEFDPVNKVLLICDNFHIAFSWFSRVYPMSVVDLEGDLEPEFASEYDGEFIPDICDKFGFTNIMPGFFVLDNEAEITLAREKNIKTYGHQIDFRTLISECKVASLVLPFDPTPYIESDERRAIQSQREKEYQAKRNNGLPTTLPFVVRDGNYEEYLKQRKRFYNRKEKIKKNKHLSAEEKQSKLKEIDRSLALLRAKVRYLSREEQVEQYRNRR